MIIEEINKENEANELESLEFSVNREEGRDINNDNPYVSVEASTGINSYNHNSKNKIANFNTEKHSIDPNDSIINKITFE